MTSFRVDTVALESASVHIGATIDRLHTEVTTLSAQLRGLDGSWSGPAAVAFADVIAEWAATSARLTDALNGIGNALRQIHAHYVDTELANTAMLGR
jgi:early secretory antigenic target protein ESAT-6